MVQLRVRPIHIVEPTSLITPCLSSPFHAAVGIMTSRMLINLRKATAKEVINLASNSQGQGVSFRTTSRTRLDSNGLDTMQFNHPQESILSMA